jgi:hypothetical protein
MIHWGTRLMSRILSFVSTDIWRMMAILAPFITLSTALPSVTWGMEISTPEPRMPGWTRLRYADTTVLGSLSTEVRIAKSDLRAMQAVVPSGLPELPLPAAPEDLLALEVSAYGHSIVKSYTASATTWFNPGDGATIQRDKLTRGGKASKRIYRYTPHGVHRLRIEPEDRNEEKEDAGNWSRVKQTYFPFDQEKAGCAVVIDPAVLFYLVSVAGLHPDSAPLRFCAFTNDELYWLSVKPQELRQRSVNYTRRTSTIEEKVEGTIEVLPLEIRATPVRHKKRSKEFEFLELRGNIRIFLDLKTGIPVQISGERRVAGKMDIKLDKVFVP